MINVVTSAMILCMVFISVLAFTFAVYACIKVVAMEKAVHSVTYIDAAQEMKEHSTGYDFETNVDQINDEIRDEEFEKDMGNKLSPKVIL